VVAGREDVGEQDEVGLVLVPRRQLEAVEVGEGHPQVLGLPAPVRAHGDVAVRAAGEAGVDRQAEGGIARLAVLAEPAGHVERHYHPVALAEADHARSNLHDRPEILVPEHDARLGGRAALVHVQIRPADRSRGDLDDHVIWMLDSGVVDVVH
jgi:propanediol utilization protein